jgi:hypothetical protein
LHHVLQPAQVLHRCWLIQPVRLAHQLPLLLGDPLIDPDRQQRGITGDQTDQREHDQRDPKQDRDQQEQPA